MSLKLAVSGATGRMGHTILELASKDKSFEVVGALENPSHPAIGKPLQEVLPSVHGVKSPLVPVLPKLSPAPNVLIDFTQPQATMGYLKEAMTLGIAIVIGTTGLNDSEKDQVREASQKIPIVMATNMSVGMNLLFALVEEAAAKLDSSYDIEIIEAHHHFKKDAPSGSAITLGESAARGRKVKLKEVSTHGREGIVGERKEGTIGFHAVRGGDIVGDHRVLFAGPGERLELTHIAHSRDSFAQGALKAAFFLGGKKNGLYDMQNVLGLK